MFRIGIEARICSRNESSLASLGLPEVLWHLKISEYQPDEVEGRGGRCLAASAVNTFTRRQGHHMQCRKSGQDTLYLRF